jgi:hypothetical protein
VVTLSPFRLGVLIGILFDLLAVSALVIRKQRKMLRRRDEEIQQKNAELHQLYDILSEELNRQDRCR